MTLVAGCGAADHADNSRNTGCPKVVLDGGGGIAMPKDGSQAPECQTSLCNYQSQAGCGDNESCVPEVTGGVVGPHCEAAGTDARGAACTGTTPCALGEACAGGYCRKLCCAGDWTVCDEGESCFVPFSFQIGSTITPTGAWVCFPVGTCSVLDPHPAACKDTEDCKVVDSRGSEACIPKSSGAVGEPCGSATGNFCGTGLTCVGQPGAEVCRRYCNTKQCGKPFCGDDEGTCVHFDRDPEGVGECTPGW